MSRQMTEKKMEAFWLQDNISAATEIQIQFCIASQ